MTKRADPDHTPTPLFQADAPDPLTPVERLLVLADLYTQHHDRIDLLLCDSVHPDTDAYAASAHQLEGSAHASLHAVRRQRLPRCEPVTNADARLAQLAYLTGGAARHLAAAQRALPTRAAEHARPQPDRHRGFDPLVRMARVLTALASLTIVEAATNIAPWLPNSARSTTPTDIDAAQRNALLEVARGHVTVIEREQHAWGHTMTADNQLLRHLEDQLLVSREAGSAPPPFSGGPLRARVRLTGLGVSALSAVIDAPLHPHLSSARPAPAPATAHIARTRR